MNPQNVIDQASEYVFRTLESDTTGHDWWHIVRVRQSSLSLEEKEGPADRFVIELAALLHDISDWKFTGGDLAQGPQIAGAWLNGLKVPSEVIHHVCTIISGISFKGAGVATPMSTLEGKIVQDADRLDALGAIGIARAFAYGGSAGQPIHRPEQDPVRHLTFQDYYGSKTTTINHFHEKLLLLKDRFNTKTARQIAIKRTRYMQQFLDQFHSEWDGDLSLPESGIKR